MSNLIKKLWKAILDIAYFILSGVFKIAHRELTDEIWDGLQQFIKFGIVGVSNTVISYLLYTGSLLAFRGMGVFQNVDYFIAQIISFVLSVLWSFYWNNKMVFTLQNGAKRNMWKALLKTYVSYSFTGLFLNSILLVLWVEVCHISEFIAPIINLVVSVPINFLINKFWAFKSN